MWLGVSPRDAPAISSPLGVGHWLACARAKLGIVDNVTSMSVIDGDYVVMLRLAQVHDRFKKSY